MAKRQIKFVKEIHDQPELTFEIIKRSFCQAHSAAREPFIDTALIDDKVCVEPAAGTQAYLFAVSLYRLAIERDLDLIKRLLNLGIAGDTGDFLR